MNPGNSLYVISCLLVGVSGFVPFSADNDVRQTLLLLAIVTQLWAMYWKN